jgi:hypothetical protein
VTCDSGAGEESPAPALLRTPIIRLAMVSPTARVVAPGWRACAGGRRRLPRPVASPRFGETGRPPGRRRAKECLSVCVVGRCLVLSEVLPRIMISGARIQRRAGLVCRSPSPVRPAVQISQAPGACSGCSCSEPGTRRRCGNLVVFLLQSITLGRRGSTVRRRICGEPTPDGASDPRWC